MTDEHNQIITTLFSFLYFTKLDWIYIISHYVYIHKLMYPAPVAYKKI